MSESPVSHADTNVSESQTSSKPKRTRTPKSSFSVTDLARLRLRARNIKSDARLSDECKVVRGILRANFTDVRKNDASVRKAKQTYNDRKPWPTTMNAHTRDIALGKKK